jgi:SPP1 family predicted phage head-tail adaptor
MRAGNLRHRVTIQQPTLSGDGMGGGTHSWSNIATVWGNVTTTSATNTLNVEEQTSDQFRTVQYYVVVLRYRGNLQTNMRLIHRNRTLEILSILNINERNWEIRMYCREGG